MKHLISEEIAQKEAYLLAKANDKEKCFYYFLDGKPLDMPHSLNSHGEIDKVCFQAFSKNEFVGVTDIIERHRQMRVVKGVHFTSNLMNICAFALLSEGVREKELKDYWLAHGLFEQFIISKIFPELSQENAVPKTDIEELIDSVFLKKQIEDSTNLIVSLIGKCTELTEFFVIQKAFQKLCEIHPNMMIDKKYKELSLAVGNMVKQREKIITSITAIIILFVVLSIVTFFFLKWDEYKIEPILTALGLGSTAFIWVLKTLFNFTFEIEILNNWNNWLFKLIFPKLYKIKELLKKEE